MRILVTYGAGFIGSHLCERLIEDGNEVLCVDNFFTRTKDNLHHLLDYPYQENARYISREIKTRLRPNLDLASGLKKTIGYFENRLISIKKYTAKNQNVATLNYQTR
jgi:nucleoside-diphosphate-sugar epimerase